MAQKSLKSATSDWNKTPAIVRESSAGGSFELSGPTRLPKAISNKSIDLRMAGNKTLPDIANMLAFKGITMIIADKDLQSVTVGIPVYSGTVGHLLDVISVASNCSFRWVNGAIIATKGRSYMIRVPQDKSLVERMASSLKTMGAEDIASSVDAGAVSFVAPQDRTPMLMDYLDRVSSNSGMIGLQVAIVNVSLSRDTDSGLDWSGLQTVLGHGVQAAMNAAATAATTATGVAGAVATGASALTNGSSSGNTGNTNNTGNTGNSGLTGGAGTGAGINVGSLANPFAAQFTSSGLTLAAGGGDFSMQALVHFLSTYGTTSTKQNLILRTLSGNEVEITSGRSTPYVSGVTTTGISSGASSTAIGGTQTKTADTGLELKITPTYDSDSGIVTMDMKLKMSSIISFINLSAGNQVGSLTQPDIQKQGFNDVARLKVGKTIVLGGLVYDQASDNRNTLAGGESLPLGEKATKMTRTAMFIIIRPTVTVYGK